MWSAASWAAGGSGGSADGSVAEPSDGSGAGRASGGSDGGSASRGVLGDSGGSPRSSPSDVASASTSEAFRPSTRSDASDGSNRSDASSSVVFHRPASQVANEFRWKATPPLADAGSGGGSGDDSRPILAHPAATCPGSAGVTSRSRRRPRQVHPQVSTKPTMMATAMKAAPPAATGRTMLAASEFSADDVGGELVGRGGGHG